MAEAVCLIDGQSCTGPEETLTSRMQETPNGRKRLLFPTTCQLNFHQKLEWTVHLAKDFGEYEPLFKEGVHRPYITVGTNEAVEQLTTVGFKDIVMVTPEEAVMCTKVIVFKYPTYLDPNFILLNNDSVMWAKRNRVRGEERSQIVALVMGEAPGRIFVQGLGYRKVAKFIEEPTLCMKCSRWGHVAWKCQFDPRCRFCGKKHDSRQCRFKIKNGERILPSCCNCRGSHNAGSSLCPMKPHLRDSRTGPTSKIDVTSKAGKNVQQEQGGNSRKPTTAMANVWETGTATIKESLGNAAENRKPCGDKVQDNIVNLEVGTQILEYLKKLDKRIEALEKFAMEGRRGDGGGETGREMGSETGVGVSKDEHEVSMIQDRQDNELISSVSSVQSAVVTDVETEDSQENELTSSDSSVKPAVVINVETEDSQDTELTSGARSVQPSGMINVGPKVKVKRFTEIAKKIDMNNVTFDVSSSCPSEEKVKILQCQERLSELLSYLMECDGQGKGSFIIHHGGK